MPAPEKLDFKKAYKAFYSPSTKRPEIIDVPPMAYLMIDGTGDPNTAPRFAQAIETLYGLAYTIKFGRKKAGAGPDFTIGPLEALWLADREGFDWSDRSAKAEWRWTAMLPMPDFIAKADLAKAATELAAKKPVTIAGEARLEVLKEGSVVQIMHIGPYDAEGPNIRRLHEAAAEAGRALRGQHHEIYLGDPRRTAPEKLKTILRQPVASRSKPR